MITNERMTVNEEREQAQSELDQAIERLNKAETLIGIRINELSERLDSIMRPESGAIPKEDRLDVVARQPSPIVGRLWSHTDALERQAERLAEITSRLDT